MIYVLSDIHGRLDRFEKMLRIIDLSELTAAVLWATEASSAASDLMT